MDRKHLFASSGVDFAESLSARRAWIENTVVGVLATLVTASLSARRAWIEKSKIWYCGTSIGRRSPQGERG